MTKPKKATPEPAKKEPDRVTPRSDDGNGSVGNTADDRRGRGRDRGATQEGDA